MARSVVALCLMAVLALTFADSAQATLGKGKFMGKGKGKGISFQTQCQEVCRPKCRLVPKAVCADVQVPYQDCDKVPVTTSVKRCGKVCTKSVAQPVVVAPVAVATAEVSVGKGKFAKFGKGRHLMTIGKGKFGKFSKGKGMMAPVSIDCDIVCQDVPITTFRTQCETMTRTVTSCKKDFEQVCENKCRPMCTKVPVMVEVQPVVVQPVMMSKGKGKGFGH